MDKPPYRVPPMAEIARIKPNGLKVISTFAGCGGSSLGYRMAGFKVLWANEFVDAARTVYEENAAPGTIVDGRDIRQVDPLEVLRALKLKPGELDVLDGSPPCASFSTAGRREKHWGAEKKYSDKVQRTDDLFFEFVRFLKAMQPRAFVAENVSGLVKGTAKGYFLEILAAMKACGYRVEARLLDAQWLGVPQARQRIIFVGMREDLDLAPAHPDPLPYRYSVRDAIPWIVSHRGNDSGQVKWKSPNEPSGSISTDIPTETHGRMSNGFVEAPIVGISFSTGGRKQAKNSKLSLDEPAHSITGNSKNATHHLVEQEADISRFAIGKESDRLSPGQQSDKYYSLVRAPLDGPSPTVTAAGGGHESGNSIASVIHPTEKRKFSIAELKRICAFPDSFVLSGHYAKDWERLGRAVPPMMMFHIASKVRDVLLESKCLSKESSTVSGPTLSRGNPKRAGRGKVLASRHRASTVISE